MHLIKTFDGNPQASDVIVDAVEMFEVYGLAPFPEYSLSLASVTITTHYPAFSTSVAYPSANPFSASELHRNGEVSGFEDTILTSIAGGATFTLASVLT